MFWVIYKNLEKEVIELSNKLHFCDEQENVYSIYISDLLIRTAVEIEALAKELYKTAGGNMKPVDNEGRERDLMFDSDCLQFLDVNWGITKKHVKVVCPNFYFNKTENLELRPLKDCNKHGQGRWKKAYQAVKHDRAESLKAGNVANLIRALAALYILNVYYRNETYSIGTIINTEPFDTRMGSDIFSVSIAHAEQYNYDKLDIEDTAKSEFDTAVLIQKYTDESFEMVLKSFRTYNEEAAKRLLETPEVVKFFKANPDYKIRSLFSFANDVGGEELVEKILHNQKIVADLHKAKIEVVLNKGQTIYPKK